ncbi:MAG: hypothetical protein JO149_04735 [Gammaproteobacteria bacterium]|nr:hypothetical protein [Gammaproteobacteria bacterium]
MQSHQVKPNIITLPNFNKPDPFAYQMQIFIKEYELFSLLPKEEISWQLEEHVETAIKELKKLYQSSQAELPSLEKIDIEARLKAQCNKMLLLAIGNRDEKLRDIAIICGANTPKILLQHLHELASKEKTLILNTDISYSILAFLLASKIDLLRPEETKEAQQFIFPWQTKISATAQQTIFATAFTLLGPAVLVLLLDHFFQKGDRFNQETFVAFFHNKDQLLRNYIESHRIDILLNVDYLKPSLLPLCQTILKLNSLAFFAAIGDEKALEKAVKNLRMENEMDRQNVYHAFEQACYFRRKNTAKLLLAEIDAHLSAQAIGVLLMQAIKQQAVDIVKLLLHCQHVNIHLIPHESQQSLYQIGMQANFEIKQLFLNKKNDDIKMAITKVEKQITYLEKQANTLFGWMGAANKATELQAALENAIKHKEKFSTENEFLNFALPGQESISVVSEKARILWGKTNSSLAISTKKREELLNVYSFKKI